jgi:hypothetical protein
MSDSNDQCTCLHTRAQHNAMGKCLAPALGIPTFSGNFGIPTSQGYCLCNRFTLSNSSNKSGATWEDYQRALERLEREGDL